MLDYRLLQTLAVVVEQGSFEQAALILFKTQSAVSQRLKQLEDQVGQLLVVRSNPVKATRYGSKLIEHYLKVSLLESNIMDVITLENKPIPIAVNADSLATWFIPAIKDLVHSNNLYFDIKVADQDITHHAFQQGEVMGCVSSRAKPLQGCKVVKLGTMKCIAVASKSFIEKYIPGRITKDKIKNTPVMLFNRDDSLSAIYLEKFYGLKMTDMHYHCIPSIEAFIAAAKNGIALSVLPEAQVVEQLKSGCVININKKHFIEITLYWHSWALETKTGKAINKAIISGAKKHLQ